MNTRILLIVAALLTSGLLAPAPAEAAGSKPAPAMPATPPPTPEEAGKTAYNYGLKHRDKAWALEDKAKAAETDAEREKLLAKAQKQYGKSIPLFETAVENLPTFHQAYSSLGYALRKTGDFEGSLAAYDRALELAPYYGEAIEYRAEAYLALGRLDEVKDAYMTLFAKERALADQLMEAMQAWVAERRAEPGDVAAEKVESFAAWLAERGQLADQTALLLGAATRVW